MSSVPRSLSARPQEERVAPSPTNNRLPFLACDTSHKVEKRHKATPTCRPTQWIKDKQGRDPIAAKWLSFTSSVFGVACVGHATISGAVGIFRGNLGRQTGLGRGDPSFKDQQRVKRRWLVQRNLKMPCCWAGRFTGLCCLVLRPLVVFAEAELQQVPSQFFKAGEGRLGLYLFSFLPSAFLSVKSYLSSPCPC